MSSTRSFSFGRNWLRYAKTVTEENIQAAEASLKRLLHKEDLNGLRILDIGCGSGLFTTAALRPGASEVVALDVDADCVLCTKQLTSHFAQDHINRLTVKRISVLSPDIETIGDFDIVYSWGVLHHTGNLWIAVNNAAGRVKPGGLLALALYNKTASNHFWLRTKQFYNFSPLAIKGLMAFALWSITVSARILKRQNPFYKKDRGMSVWYDTTDWLGGLPYEWASVDEVTNYIKSRGFEIISVIPVKGFKHGCNEYLFQKIL
jgi:2-polyprenyl-6-hydroxyphenyl methylase/3-demethylubiquinone-9 3-methyltransferase